MSETGTIDRKQNNLSDSVDEQDPGTPPPDYTQAQENDEAIQSEVRDSEQPQTIDHEAPMTNGSIEQQNMSVSAESMADAITRYLQPHQLENQRLSGSVESTQSGTVIQNASSEEITELAPQQTTDGSPKPEESPWVRVLRLVWPNGAQQRRKRLVFVGKFELILGMYLLIFGVVCLIVTNQMYDRWFIPAYGAVAGYGTLLLISGSCKAFTSPSENNVTANTVFSFICYLVGNGVAVFCLYDLLNISLFYYLKFEFPYMLAVACATACATAWICLLHVGCFCKGKNIPLERVQIIVSTNTRTGEKFFETVQPQPQYMEPSVSTPDVTEQFYPGSSQDMMQQQGIPMSHLGRSTSMRTIENQYVERTNHELPQQFHTVHRHPVTMEQYRQQEMRYATSEFNSMQPVQTNEKQPFDQTQFVNIHAQSDFDPPRAMTEVNYPQPRTIVGHQYAQSEVGHSRAMTEVDYPQSQTISRHQYAQSEVGGHPRVMTDVDYPQTRTMLPEQYARSEIGQPRTVTQGDYPQSRTLHSHQLAKSELGHSRSMTAVDYPQPRQHYVQSEMGHARTVNDYQQPRPMPGHPYARSEVGRPIVPNEIQYSPSIATPSRQYTRSEVNQTVTMARYPQYIPEENYPMDMPHIPASQNTPMSAPHEAAYPPTMPEMRRQMHPQAEMGFRTVPSHSVPYQAAPSEAGYSYTASESGYPSNQGGRISPRMALAERQMRMEAARQESLMRRQPPVRNGSQQYIVATRQYR